MELPKIEDLIKKIDELITAIQGGNSGGPSGGPRINLPNIDLKDVQDKALKGLSAVGTTGLALASTFEALSGKKDAVLAAMDRLALGNPIAKYAVGQLKAGSEANETATKSGASTAVLEQRTNEMGNRVTYADLQKAMAATGTGLTSAGTLQADRLTNINATLTKLNADQGMKGRFETGMTDPDTLAKALIISQQRSKGNLSTSEGQDKAVVNAGKLADVIGDTAARIGVDRDTIATQTAERMKDGTVQATLQTLQTEEQKQAFIRSQAGLTGFGKNVQDLAADFVALGGPTEATKATMVALGPAGHQLRDAMLQLKNATNEEERAKAEASLEVAKRKINERGEDPRSARLAMAARAFPDVPALQGFKQQFEQNKEQAGYQFQRNQGATPAAAQAAIATQQKNRQSGLGPQGEELSAEQKLQGVILEGNRLAATGAATWMGKFNDELNKSPANIQAMITELKKLEANPATRKEGDTSVGVDKKYEVKKDLGTLGTTGQTFEPRDIIALLHKGERVLNPKENTDLTSLYEMIGNLKPKEGAETTEAIPDIGTDVASEESAQSGTDSITLKDVHDSLQRLNSTMEVMASHTADMKDTNRTTADMSQKMTGNRLAV
jgi:hypothetical protein